jgi:biopolymer transport protein ExbB/TolQ
MGDALTYIADVFAKSGTVGTLTALLLFVCLGVAIERVLFWSRFTGRGKGIDDVARLACAGRFVDADRAAGRSHDRLLGILGAALSRLREPAAWSSVRESALEEALGGNVTRGRRFLITSIQVFGLLGMLGTCKGLYAQLSGMGAAADAASIQTAMGGMGEAFTTTLVGLAAAALATPLYLLNEMAVERFTRRLRLYDHRIQAALTEFAGTKPSRGGER